MNTIVLITGATSGIGEAASLKFAQHGNDLILIGRRKERLLKLSANLRKKYSVEVLPLVIDVRNRKAVQKAIESLPIKWKKIDVLINNAGLALGIEPIQEGVIEDWETMIDTNIKGLLYVTRYVVPLMIKNKKGHIVNIGSIAGKEVYPNGNIYCATKSAVNALTKGMRIDLVKHGIKVTQVAPGAAETEFSLVRYRGNKTNSMLVYKGFHALQAKDIADIIYYTTTLPSHVNINDLVVTATAQASAAIFFRK